VKDEEDEMPKKIFPLEGVGSYRTDNLDRQKWHKDKEYEYVRLG